ncbi:hypothetical protein MY8738_004286 [Beauveria namnaoensis]
MAPYSESDVKKALDLLKSGLSFGKASQLAGVPRSTLYDRKNGRNSARQAFEKQQKLSAEWERTLVSYVVEQSQLGRTPTHQQIKAVAKSYLASSGQATTIGKNWLNRFIKRHPEIATILVPPTEKDQAEGATRPTDIDGTTSNRDIEHAASSSDLEGATSSGDIESGISSSDAQQACHACHMCNYGGTPIDLWQKLEKRISDQSAEIVQLREIIGHLVTEVRAQRQEACQNNPNQIS